MLICKLGSFGCIWLYSMPTKFANLWIWEFWLYSMLTKFAGLWIEEFWLHLTITCQPTWRVLAFIVCQASLLVCGLESIGCSWLQCANQLCWFVNWRVLAAFDCIVCQTKFADLWIGKFWLHLTIICQPTLLVCELENLGCIWLYNMPNQVCWFVNWRVLAAFDCIANQVCWFFNWSFGHRTMMFDTSLLVVVCEELNWYANLKWVL